MNILKQHWEKLLLAAVVVVALIVTAISFTSGSESDSFSKTKKADSIQDNSALLSYQESIKFSESKVADTLTPNSFLHDELQYCPSCKKLQPKWSLVCPECGKTVDYKADADEDGMPNKWEQKYGLDWTSAKDANLDADNDGITNLEEYKRNSNPKDASDPNIILDDYTVLKVYRPSRPIMLMLAKKGNLQFKYKGRTKFRKEGQKISDGATPVYEIGTVTTKKIGVWNKMINSTQYIDKSEVTMTDVKTSKPFTLVIGETNYYEYVEGEIQAKDGSKPFIIRKNSEIELPTYKEKAKVESLDEHDKSCTFDVKGRKYKVKAKK